jgi:hypothetical protein
MLKVDILTKRTPPKLAVFSSVPFHIVAATATATAAATHPLNKPKKITKSSIKHFNI